jgi:hypothetical protein
MREPCGTLKKPEDSKFHGVVPQTASVRILLKQHERSEYRFRKWKMSERHLEAMCDEILNLCYVKYSS